METHTAIQGGFVLIAMICGSLGCASHGELVSLREEMQRGLSQTRAYLNERIDKAGAQLEAAEVLQTKLKELQAVQHRQQGTLSELKQELSKLDGLHAAVKDLKAQPEALKRAIDELKAKTDSTSQELGRLQGIVRVWNETLVQSGRLEQESLRARLKNLDRSIHDLEAVGLPHQRKTSLSHDRATTRE